MEKGAKKKSMKPAGKSGIKPVHRGEERRCGVAEDGTNNS